MNRKQYRDKIKEKLDFDCECGYNFMSIIDDAKNMPMLDYNRILEGFLPCMKCGKEIPMEDIEFYFRKKKIENIIKNVKH